MTTTALHMGLFDKISSFLNKREGDFIKLEDTSTFGPGPLLILYKVPSGIGDDEVQDMLSDGAPRAFQKGIRLWRISNIQDALLQEPMSSVLDQAAKGEAGDGRVQTTATLSATDGCPVLFFSGFDNAEMMASYNIIGQEIYHESAGALSPACAKAVPNAMEKPFSQVLEEISGDHMEAIEINQRDDDQDDDIE